ncbi:MAG: acyl-CoA/acyl-ACP dehydrogenase [Chloroflexi bacterium]|nr:acyl-CoA/acyl-ACP dehydrogenase [Chloroflexota bacterium]
MALLELQPETSAGARLVECAEALTDQLGAKATEHDTAGTFPFENIQLLKQAGYFVAPVPEQFGGQGVESLHDILVASSRLARGDASTTIGLNMHLLVVMNIARRWRTAAYRGNERRATAFARSLETIVTDEVVIAAAISEPQQHLAHPNTRAVRNEHGWLLNGRKIFCTMSPAASILLVSVTYDDGAGTLLYGYAEVPVNTPGVIIHDDWDALGMRASGSNSITLCDVQLPESALRGGFPVGSAIGYIERNLANGLFHVSTSLGIAESVHEAVIEKLAMSADGHVGAAEQMLVADNAMSLSAMRATFARAATLVDRFDLAHLQSDPTPTEWNGLFAEVQTAKAFVQNAATQIVERAMLLCGGAAYRRTHRLSRAYRDVRAGGFMHPLSTLKAYEFIARALLGLEASLS